MSEACLEPGLLVSEPSAFGEGDRFRGFNVVVVVNLTLIHPHGCGD